METASPKQRSPWLYVLLGCGGLAGLICLGSMIVLGPRGFLWAVVGLHVAVALFFLYRMLAWRLPLAKRPWSEVSLPARAFFVPATIIAMSQRRRRRRTDGAG